MVFPSYVATYMSETSLVAAWGNTIIAVDYVSIVLDTWIRCKHISLPYVLVQDLMYAPSSCCPPQCQFTAKPLDYNWSCKIVIMLLLSIH